MIFLRNLAFVWLLCVPLPVFADFFVEIKFADSHLQIKDAWVHSSHPNARVGAVYLCIKNFSKYDERLIDVYFDKAKQTQLHISTMKDGVMVMRHVKDGFLISAQDTLSLRPMGKHIMLMGLNQSLKEGEMLDFELTFENYGKIGFGIPVKMRKKVGEKCD